MSQTFPASALSLGIGRQAGAAQSRHYTSRLALAMAAVLAAAWLDGAHLLDNRLHPDEALYATFARYIASGPGRGLLLSHLLVDKPPLSFYLNGLSVAILGPSEFALRLPTLLASLVSVALLYAIGRRLFGAPAGLAAAWIMALSPFAIQFSITVFVDPLLTTWLLLGIWLMVRGRTGWAALALALAWATKQSALLFVPLALLLGLASLPRPVRLRRALTFLAQVALPALAGIVLVTLLLIAWDVRRDAPISLFAQGYGDNAATRLATPGELQPRAVALLNILHGFTGNDALSLLFLAGLAGALAFDASQGRRGNWVGALLVIYLAGYLGGYWLVSLNLFDRYFLPILPLCALLAGRVVDLASQALAAGLAALGRLAGRNAPQTRRAASLAARALLPLGLLLVLIPVTAAANYNFSPIGGDHGIYDGIDDAARFVHSLPRNSVLYDHWLSWELDYYLFDRPVRTIYYRDGRDLERDLFLYGQRAPHYLILPWWAKDFEPRMAVRLAGYAMHPIHRSLRRDGQMSFTIYQLAATSK